MSLERKEYIVESGEHKTDGSLEQTIALPNGNFLCLHSPKRKTYSISVYDPVNRKTIAKSQTYDGKLYFGLVPISHDRFIYLNSTDVYRMVIRENTLIEEARYNVGGDFRKHHLFGNTLILVNYNGLGASKYHQLNVDTFKCKTTTEARWEIYKYSFPLPSEKIVSHNAGNIQILNDIFDETPIQIKPVVRVQTNFDGVAFSETIIVYGVGYVDDISEGIHKRNKFRYCIQSLDTDQSLEIEIFRFDSEELVHARVTDDKTLICNGYDFFIFDHVHFKLIPIKLGLEVEDLCTSVAFTHGQLAMTFKDNDTLYITDAIKPGIDFTDLTLFSSSVIPKKIVPPGKKAETYACKMRDPLVGVSVLPDGNFACQHMFDGERAHYFSIFDSVHEKIIAKSESLYNDFGILLPISSQIFYMQNCYYLKQFQVFKKQMLCNIYYKIFECSNIYLSGKDNTKLIGQAKLHDSHRDFSADPVSVKIEETQDKKHDTFHPLPSGKIVEYCASSTGEHEIQIFDDLFEQKPIRTLVCDASREAKVGKHAVALSESVIAYDVEFKPSNDSRNYVIYNLDTEESIKINIILSKYKNKLIFAPLLNDQTLIASGSDFLVLDNKTLKLDPVELGFENKAACTGLAYDPVRGLLAVAFENNATLYISDVIKLQKTIEDQILEALDHRVSRSLVKIVNGYCGLRLFSKDPIASEDKAVSHSVTLSSRG